MHKIVNNTTCTILLTAYITSSLITLLSVHAQAYSNIDACTPASCEIIYEAKPYGPTLPDCSRYTDNIELVKAFSYDCELVNIMQAIVMAESGASSTAINHHNTNGSIDVGLLQINTIHRDKGESIAHFKERMLDQSQNITKAAQIYKTQGLKAWVTYNTGAYIEYIK